VAIVSGKQNEELQKQGKLLAGSRVEIAQVGFTVFVKKGAAKPDLSSADALKRALLAAKSVASVRCSRVLSRAAANSVKGERSDAPSCDGHGAGIRKPSHKRSF